MKLRIRGNSLRLRVGPAEVERLATGKSVEEMIRFGPTPEQTLCYMIETSHDVSTVEAIFHANCIRILLPLVMAEKWGRGNEIGIESHRPIGAGATLKVLIEKDFKCIDGRADDEELDAYPNPKRRANC